MFAFCMCHMLLRTRCHVDLSNCACKNALEVFSYCTCTSQSVLWCDLCSAEYSELELLWYASFLSKIHFWKLLWSSSEHVIHVHCSLAEIIIKSIKFQEIGYHTTYYTSTLFKQITLNHDNWISVVLLPLPAVLLIQALVDSSSSITLGMIHFSSSHEFPPSLLDILVYRIWYSYTARLHWSLLSVACISI